MKNRITALVLILAFVMSFVSAASATEAIEMYDNFNTRLCLSEQMLEIIGINEEISEPVTRADFVYTLGQLLKWQPIGDITVPFGDIPAGDYRISAICAGLKLGYISSADSFSPDEPIRPVDAVKLAACAAGLRNLAEAKGGYPSGYITCADDAGIIDDVDLSADTLSHEDFLIILFNTMNCAYMYETNIGDSFSYISTPGRTLLTDIHGISLFEGLVTATPRSKLTNSGSVADGTVEIEGSLYSSLIDMSEYLGYHTTGFYQKSGSGYKIISAVKTNNKVISFESADLISYPPSDSNIKIYTDKKETTLKLSGTYDFIYNGVSYPTHANSCYPLENISYTLVDNNEDSIYDVVFAYENTYYTIGELSDLNYEIADIIGISEKISLSDIDVRIYASDENGEPVEWYNLKSSAVIAAQISKNKKLVNLKTLSGTVTGVVDEITTADSTITISGTKYKVSSYCTAVIGDIKTGISYSFVTDGNLLVSPVQITNVEMYGYIIESGITTGLGKEVCIRMLRDTGKIEEISLAKKIKLNGSSDTASDSPAVSAVIGVRQLVKYKLNSDNKIISLRVASTMTKDDYPFENRSAENTDFRLFNVAEKTPHYKSGTRNLLPYGSVQNTIFFVVPGGSPTVAEEEIFDVTNYTGADLENKTDYPGIKLYDITSNGMCKVAVYETNTPLSQNMTDAGFAIIEKITSSVNADGDKTSKVYLLTENGYAAYVTKPEFNVSSFECGDVVRFVTNSKGEIANMLLDFDISSDARANLSFNDMDTNADNSYIISRLYSYEDGYAYLSPVGSVDVTAADSADNYTWEKLHYISLDGTIVVYDVSSGEARYGTTGDLKSYKHGGSGSFTLIKINKYFDGEFIVIYE